MQITIFIVRFEQKLIKIIVSITFNQCIYFE